MGIQINLSRCYFNNGDGIDENDIQYIRHEEKKAIDAMLITFPKDNTEAYINNYKIKYYYNDKLHNFKTLNPKKKYSTT